MELGDPRRDHRREVPVDRHHATSVVKSRINSKSTCIAEEARVLACTVWIQREPFVRAFTLSRVLEVVIRPAVELGHAVDEDVRDGRFDDLEDPRSAVREGDRGGSHDGIDRHGVYETIRVRRVRFSRRSLISIV